MTARDIIFLFPQLKPKPWGGTRLATDFSYELPSDHVGECWTAGAHENGDSIVLNGRFKGQTLSELWTSHRELFGSVDLDKFPLLLKIIDAQEPSSIQVHPDNEYAMKHENGSLGKTESWYILDCPDNAELVLGHNAQTKEEFERMIADNRWTELIRTVPIKKGDFIQINAGMLHTITAGLLVLEVQQSSDITYRFYDYGRKINGKERELHSKQCIDVVKVPDNHTEKCIMSTTEMPCNIMNQLVKCPYYTVWKMDIVKEARIEQEYPFLVVNVVEGFGTIDSIAIRKGDSFIIPADYGTACLEGNLQLIMASV